MDAESKKAWLEQFKADIDSIDIPVISKAGTIVKEAPKRKYNIPPQGPDRIYSTDVDVNLVKFFLKESLLSVGYDIALLEFEYRRSFADVYGVVSDRSVEFEIKRNRYDYWQDFRKVLFVGSVVNKHSALASGSAGISKFFFVVPEGMIDLDECPDHAGLIYYIMKDGIPWFKVIKHAPLLCKDFVAPGIWRTIAKKLMLRTQNYLHRYTESKFIKLRNEYYADLQDNNSRNNTPNKRKKHTKR